MQVNVFMTISSRKFLQKWRQKIQFRTEGIIRACLENNFCGELFLLLLRHEHGVFNVFINDTLFYAVYEAFHLAAKWNVAHLCLQ